MYTTIYSGALFGVSAYLVSVEVDIDRGLPTFSMVGSLGSEVRESRERVMVALKNAGIEMPPERITVNLSPGDRRKEGTAFDLPIAVGILESMGYVQHKGTDNILFLGELGLNGELKKAKGVLPIVREAAECGIVQCIVPRVNAREGAVIPGITVRGADNIGEVLCFLLEEDEERREKLLPTVKVDAGALFTQQEQQRYPDFSQVSGQEGAKRAAEIAAAGFHNLLMIGPPGAGKSMIAKRIPGILPPLSLAESLEVTSVVSVAGLMEEEGSLVTQRPFQSPHHSITQAALIGGTSVPKPGIISLAHRGVLFLDELPEFQRSVLDSLRQPIEEKRVTLSRAGGNVTYPSDVMMVCAMNPCPCGFYPNKNRCICTDTRVRQYMGKVSGPILDRIDLCVELHPVDVFSLQNEKKSEGSADIRKRVLRARERQTDRFRGTGYRFNGDIEAAVIDKYCSLGRSEKKTMKQLYQSLQLSARAYHRILKVARTIADLEGAEQIEEAHLLEAAFYRPTLDLQG